MDKELYNECLICGKSYKRCRVCEMNRGTWASWKQFTDCPECFQVLTSIQGYTTKTTSKEEAAEELKKCNLSRKSIFLPRIQELIDEILMEDEPVTAFEIKADLSVSTDEEGTKVVETLENTSSPSPHRRNKKSRRTALPNM